MQWTKTLIFFFNDTATTEIYTLSLHDALPISPESSGPRRRSSSSPGPGSASPPRAWSTVYNEDRKSTRLNSSHDQISYAVFCLKKKNKTMSTKDKNPINTVPTSHASACSHGEY